MNCPSDHHTTLQSSRNCHNVNRYGPTRDRPPQYYVWVVSLRVVSERRLTDIDVVQ